ncbi:MAG: lysophospholipid acyltransferase family protein [Candidatus Cloacimonetes bacterium]|nr:lysophospholipid acyltransferase family protein [Candidatus Cloacimonadota bacterium]
MRKIFFFLEKYTVALFVLILGSTLRYKLRTLPPEGNVIYAFWHRNMIPLLFLHKFEKAVILISGSKDGDLIANPAHALGYLTSRGSSRRGGSSAIKKLIKLSQDHCLAITPDGPKGPGEKVKNGVVFLSYFTGKPIIPIAVDINWEKVFNSWDRFRLPKLFSQVYVAYGEPIFVNSKDEIKAKVQEVQKAMEELNQQNKI